MTHDSLARGELMSRVLAAVCALCVALMSAPGVVRAQVDAVDDDLPIVPLEPIPKKKKRKKKRRVRKKSPTRVLQQAEPKKSPAPASEDIALPVEPEPASEAAPELDDELELTPIELPTPEAPLEEELNSPEPTPARAPVEYDRIGEVRSTGWLYGSYAALGAGILAAGVGAYYGSQSREFDGLERGSTGETQLSAQTIREDSESAASIATGAWIASGVLGAAGLGMLAVHVLGDEDEPSLQVAPQARGLGLWLFGRF
ncbi:MAG: hypothetical protein AAFQ82_19420 [Myxococcota bacterium]